MKEVLCMNKVVNDCMMCVVKYGGQVKVGRTVGSFILNVLVKIIAMKQFKNIVKSLVN